MANLRSLQAKVQTNDWKRAVLGAPKLTYPWLQRGQLGRRTGHSALPYQRGPGKPSIGRGGVWWLWLGRNHCCGADL